MKPDPSSGWILQASDRTDYTPPTMANGMIGLVASETPLQISTVILNGVYDKYGRGNVSNIVQGIRFADLDVRIGEKQVSNETSIDGWQQALDMRRGCLTTRFTFDGQIQIVHRLYALRHLPYTALVTLELTAMQDVTVTVTNKVSLPDILVPVENTYKVTNQVPLLSTVANSPTGRHRIAAANSYLFDGPLPELVHETLGADTHAVHLTLGLEKNAICRLGVIGSICTTADFYDPANEAERLSIFGRFEGCDKLVDRHMRAWAALWQGDIIIEGDSQVQRDVRFALYNLYSFARQGSGHSLSPMGLSSTGYNGHIFWDCELWMFPPLLMLQPQIARSLLDYRFDRLEQAKLNARSHGFCGAMFPWESDDTGQESTPTWAFTGSFEHHITACVGIAFWNYYCVTGDKVWLAEKGWPLLKQVAEFWANRVEKNDDGQYEIKNVIGADEYTDVVDNNAFTNGAAKTVLYYAIQAARELGLSPDPQWATIADHIVLRSFEGGITQEYDNYDGRTIKQADVNLLAYPLSVITDQETIRRDLAYYEPRMDVDAPAMSHSVLSIISSRLGDAEKAYALFERAYRPNQKPPFGALTETPYSHNPYFATAAGGMLQAVLAGFAGLEIAPQGIVQTAPCLPKAWTSLTVTGVGLDKKTFTLKGKSE
ncbi:MAG: glycoside hydrolase family 65 protein [Anaerolineae bacterium]|nr:glycoside hydrolase family 65 protein [Anaerolineae bacterium]